MECNLVWDNEQEKIVRCINCNRTRVTTQNDLFKIHYICKANESDSIIKRPAPPPQITRIKNFTKAAISHITAGSPTCTQEEIDVRHAICVSCPLFINYGNDKGICSHANCGCNISKAQIYLNKLGWRDQSCPINKWGPIEEK